MTNHSARSTYSLGEFRAASRARAAISRLLNERLGWNCRADEIMRDAMQEHVSALISERDELDRMRTVHQEGIEEGQSDWPCACLPSNTICLPSNMLCKFLNGRFTGRRQWQQDERSRPCLERVKSGALCHSFATRWAPVRKYCSRSACKLVFQVRNTHEGWAEALVEGEEVHTISD